MPVHGGELLRLVDDEMPVPPVPVGGRPLGDAHEVPGHLPGGEHVRGDEIGRAQLVGILPGDLAVGRLEDVQHVGGVGAVGFAPSELVGPGGGPSSSASSSRSGASAIVHGAPSRAEQRGIRARRDQPLTGREQLGKHLLRGQHRPQLFDGRVEAEVRAQVVAQLGPHLRRHLRRTRRLDLREVAEPAEQVGELGRVLQLHVQPLHALRRRAGCRACRGTSPVRRCAAGRWPGRASWLLPPSPGRSRR